MDFALKQSGDLSALLLQLRWGLCDTLNHLSFFCGDHSLSKYAITTTFLVTLFTCVKKIKLGPTSLITKPSVNLWPQCVNKNTISVMTMLANPFWLITPEISPVYTKELHLTFTTTLSKLLRKKKIISLYLQHLEWWLDRKISGENVHKLLEDGIPSEINWC